MALLLESGKAARENHQQIHAQENLMLVNGFKMEVAKTEGLMAIQGNLPWLVVGTYLDKFRGHWGGQTRLCITLWGFLIAIVRSDYF